MADWIEPGSRAPQFVVNDDHGNKVKLSDWRGQRVVLYFYPKADTPGCTKESCAFRDANKQIAKLGAQILGISPDLAEDQAAFRDKYKLNFPLLADANHKIAEKYGAWREKNMYGNIKMGIVRSTYIIDADGLVAKVWKRVQVEGHDQKVIEALEKMLVG